MSRNWRTGDKTVKDFSTKLLTLNISDSGAASEEDLPETVLPRPCYLGDLRKAVDVEVSELAFMQGEGESSEGESPEGYVVLDGKISRMTSKEQASMNATMMTMPAMETWDVGTVHELHYTYSNKHALHIHVNPFQIVELPDYGELDGWFKEGDYQDTFSNGNVNDTDVIKLRVMTDMFTGRMMFHCHVLVHEDKGLMGFIDVVGDEGGRYHSLKELSPACHT